MLVRVAQLVDIETLFEIRTSVIENHQSREEIAELGITPETIAQMLQSDCCAWLAELDQQAIGFAIANKTEKTIFGIFVLPDFEGRGAGRKLMQAAESWFRANNIEEIWLVTGNNPDLRAYGFYLHLGWIAVGAETEGAFTGEMRFVKKLELKR
ncbi:MAG: GNAT family N-acetyltransferase [Almyronema sp.]